ncbi:MAG: PEGA domain-containing protein [Sediminispirochaetaceae bacterium]
MKRLIHFGVFTGILLMLLAGCASVPRASSPDQSLLVVLSDLEFDPPPRLTVQSEEGSERVDFERDGLAFLPVAPGDVRFGEGERITVPVGAVVLYPQVVGPEGYRRDVLPADQRRAMEVLTRYVGFEEWFGREYVNFGPFRPKQYLSGEYFPLEVSSDPAGCTITIDNVVWGETPQTLELNAGKYLIEISREGYSSYRRVVTVDEPMTLSPRLLPLEDDRKQQEQFEIMVSPFLSMNPQDNPYGDVITSTMLINLDSDPRLRAVLADGPAPGSPYPDFSPAEEAGADLMVSGRYHLEDETLYLEAVLYETTSRRVKTAETYVTETGFAVFESIDEISAGFAEAVSRSLPHPGSPIMEKESAIGEQLVVYEQQIYRDRMIRSRLDRKNQISMQVGIGGLDDYYEYAPDEKVGLDSANPNQLRVNYQRIKSDHISLSAAVLMVWGGVNEHDSMTPIVDSPNLLTSFAVMGGSELAFRTETSDVYFTPSLLAGFMPPYSITTTIDYDIPVRYYAGLELDVGYRYYFYQSRDRRPYFINLGMYFDMIEFAFSPGEDPQIVGIRGALYLGGGTVF